MNRARLAPLGFFLLAGFAPQEERPRIYLVTDKEDSRAVRSLRTLWKDRLVLAREPAPSGVAIVLAGDVRPWAESGATVVADLPLFARLFGGRLNEVTLENPNHLPIDPYDIRSIEAAGKDFSGYRNKGVPPSERTVAIRAGLKAERAEPIPSIRIVENDPALRGFSPGDVLPWCGEAKGIYRQRTLEGADAKVLAVSTVNGQAVFVRKGKVYGLDLDMDEPNERWDNRGAFHKWVPVSNLAGPGVRGGRYWPKKPTYAEYAAEVRAFAASHPEWKLDAVGRRGTDDIYSLTLGDPGKPLYVFVGMLHAEDEWMPALGLLSFADLLGRSRDLPEVRARLERFSVKIYPLLHPAVYESPLAEPGRPREKDAIDLDKTRHDRPYSIAQFHQGGDVLVPACGTPMATGRAIADRARRDFAGRHVWWWYIHGRYGPQEWEAQAPCAEMPPSWSVYWWQDGRTSCYGLYPHEVAFSAKAMYFVEQEFILLMPERFTQANAHFDLHCMLFEHSSVASLLLTDQTANWGMAIFLTDHAGLDRDPEWRPAGK